MISALVFNNMDGMASTETKTVDLTMYMKGDGLTYEPSVSSTMVTATVDAAGMLSVSIDKMSTYSDYKVDITATDSRGAVITDDVVVRRNQKPVTGKLEITTNEIWVGTQPKKNTADVSLTLKGNSCGGVAADANGACHFGDDDRDLLTFEVASGNMRLVTGAHKSNMDGTGKVTIMGQKTTLVTGTEATAINGDTVFAQVAVAVRAKDSGELDSDYKENLVLVRVNQAPKEKAKTYLPARAIPLNAATEQVTIGDLKAVFEDNDAPDLGDHTITLKSSDTSKATVTEPVGTTDTDNWVITAVGTGTATITVTLTEPEDEDITDTDDRWKGLGQTATQTFTVTVRDDVQPPAAE